MEMKIAQMRKYDISNGSGIRATLFVSGCTHNCKGCFNKQYQDFNYGTEWSKEQEEKFMSFVLDDKVVGVNILGGEPLQQTMDSQLANLLALIKEKTEKPIWLWTGYKLEDVVNNNKVREILKNVDVLIDGKFDENLKDLNLKYKGSSNQRVIDLKSYWKLGIPVTLDNL